MKKFITIFLVSMLFLTLMPDSTFGQQPPYQLSIVMKMPGNYENPIHLCNGAIIFERLIATTAGCLHIQFGPNGKLNKLDASEISVIAGSTNARYDAIQMNVSSIDLAKNYNPITGENDLALLTLSRSLPLETRSDIKWIMIDDNSHMNKSCLVNFYTRNTKDAIADYYQTEELYLVNNEICRNLTKYPAARKRDICSFYVLPHQFNCAKANSFLSFNNDRGTALVCKSFLVGLLSSVVTRPNPANNCSDVTLRAIYTNINPHLTWIYSIMATMEPQYISTPYDASVKPLLANSGPSANITNSTSTSISTDLSYPFTNRTMPTNSSIFSNSTLTNSTYFNSTILNYATPHPLPMNSTKWNTTSIGNPPRNHTIKSSGTFNNGASIAPMPGYGAATDPHLKHPKPAVQSIFKNSGVLVRFSGGIVLIPLIFLRLIAFYL